MTEDTTMNEVYLLTGGNMGNRLQYLEQAAASIEKNIGAITRRSAVYETAAWGLENQDAFLNQVLEIRTHLDPGSVLAEILGIEENMGRKREQKYGPRIIDIDILFFNDEVIDRPGLKLPHPQMQFRRFVLEPLSQLIPSRIHPLLKKTVKELLDECQDPLPVNKFN